MADTKTVIIRKVPLEIFWRFKEKCVKERKSQQAKIIELMDKYSAKN